MREDFKQSKATVCAIGLGHVGLPLADAFSRSLKVIGFDTDARKVKRLNQSKSNQNLFFINFLICSSEAPT